MHKLSGDNNLPSFNLSLHLKVFCIEGGWFKLCIDHYDSELGGLPFTEQNWLSFDLTKSVSFYDCLGALN